MHKQTSSLLARFLTAVTLSTLLVSSTSFAEPAAARAKKTANDAISYMMKVYKVVNIDDCKAALDAVTKFGASNATHRDEIAAELAAAREDKEYGAALKAEMKKAQGKLKGIKKPKCAQDPDVRAAIRSALPKGL
jgi:hypothetical protein